MNQIQQKQLIESMMEEKREAKILEKFFEDTVDLLHELLGVSRCLVFLPDAQNTMRVCHVSKLTPEGELLLNSHCVIVDNYQSLLREGQSIVFSKIDRFLPFLITQIFENYNIRSLLIMPILYQRSYLGVIYLQHCQNDHQWNEQELKIVRHMANQAAIAIYQAQKIKAIEQQEYLEDLVKIRTQKLEEEKQQTEAANKVKSEFLSHMNHELRTPITGILGFSRMLIDEIYGSLNQKQKQYVSAIASSGEHLLSLVNDFLDISKIEADKEELFLETFPVEDVCLSSMSIVQERAREEGLELKLDICSTVDFCVADQRRLKQILVNLLSNAIKFTEVGTVTLRVYPNQNMLEFSVVDTGIGINKTDQEKLFQPFQQVNNHLNRKYKGTGLGLALSRKLAQLHGGDLTLTSEEGKGSCFTVYLPI